MTLLDVERAAGNLAKQMDAFDERLEETTKSLNRLSIESLELKVLARQLAELSTLVAFESQSLVDDSFADVGVPVVDAQHDDTDKPVQAPLTGFQFFSTNSRGEWMQYNNLTGVWEPWKPKHGASV